MQDEFKWKREKSALSFGIMALILGLPTVFFFQLGVFDEYDYWAGTVSLVLFALLETILFVWVFGIDKGWAEINRGADIRLPIILKYVMKYVTPVLLLFVFLGSLFTPQGNEWQLAFQNLFSGQGWILDNSSLVKQLAHAGLNEQIAAATDPVVRAGLEKQKLYITGARILLLSLFIFITVMVYIAGKRREKQTTQS